MEATKLATMCSTAQLQSAVIMRIDTKKLKQITGLTTMPFLITQDSP